MFLPWSVFSSKSEHGVVDPVSKEEQSKRRRWRRRGSQPKVEFLEDRLAPAAYHVDVLSPTAGAGTISNPFKHLQSAINAATANPGVDDIIVYGNSSSNPQNVYVWTRDGDRDGNGLLDGNMIVAPNDSLTFRAVTLLQGPAGTPAPIVVKLANNIIDIRGLLRVEGQSDTSRVYFTSIQDDTRGGDTNGDGDISAPNRLDWGGIRFRSTAVDQGLGSSSGAFVQFADIRYTGQTLFDEVALADTEFAAIRMEGDTFAPNAVMVRVWDTIFQHGSKALDVNFRSLAGNGPDIGNTIPDPTAGTGVTGSGTRISGNPITFVDNSINGLFVNIPFVPIVTPFSVTSRWDDIGIPYVLTQRLIVTQTLTIDPGMIIKSQREQIDTTTNVNARLIVNGTVNQPVLFTAVTDDDPGSLLAPYYNNGSTDTNNDGATTTPVPGDWGGIQVNNGNIDHAIIRYGGGEVPFNGVFVDRSPLSILTNDLRPLGPLQDFRVSNTEITQTRGGAGLGGLPNGGMPAMQVLGNGLISVIDNYIHDNPNSFAIYAGSALPGDVTSNNGGPNYTRFAHPLGGYGVHYHRNILENNLNNGVYAEVVTGDGYFDDSDIVQTIGTTLTVAGANQVRQLMSQRTVTPSINAGYLDRYQQAGIPASNPQFAAFVNQLQGQGALLGPNPLNGDNTLFYYLIDFRTTVRGLTIPGVAPGSPGNIRGEEWRDWGVDFRTSAAGGLFPFTVMDIGPGPVNPNVLTTSALDDNSSIEMVFPDLVTAIGFWIVNNLTTSSAERIEFFGDQDQLLETIQLPTTGAGPVFIGRVSRAPIHRIVIHENGGDGDQMGLDDVYFMNAGQSLVVKMGGGADITAGSVGVGDPNSPGNLNGVAFDGRDILPNQQMSVGPTLRILGQPNNPVRITSLADDSVGAGVFGHVQTDTNNAPAQPAPADWVGIRLLPGVNSSRSEILTQLLNGTLLRQSSDLNPYTIGDEPGSIADRLTRLVDGRVPAVQNLQDGTLLEHADIRFATVGIDNQGFPQGKLSLENNSMEGTGRNVDDTTATAQILQPINMSDAGAIRLGASSSFASITGTAPAGFDVDMYKVTNVAGTGPNDNPLGIFPDPGLGFLSIYVDIDHTRNQFGANADAGNVGQFNVWGFNFQDQLVYANSRDIVNPYGLGTPTAGSANYMGPMREWQGDVPADFNSDPSSAWDLQYIVVTPRGVYPTVLIDNQITNGGITGRLNVMGIAVVLSPLDPVNGGGFTVQFVDQDGVPQDTIQASDMMVNPPFNAPPVRNPIHQSVSQNYEMEIRMPNTAIINGNPVDIHRGRQNDAVRNLDGQIILRQNLVRDFLTAGIYLHDHWFDSTIDFTSTVTQDVATQSGRYFYPNLEPNITPTGVFSNPNNYLPGAHVYNNVITNGGGHAVQVIEHAFLDALGNTFPAPSNYAQILNNTMHNNSGNGVELETRGGPNILNNIFTRNSTGVRITDLGFGGATTVVNYNLFYQNAANVVGPSNGGNNTFNQDPLYVDVTNQDLRIFFNSPAVDAALSNLSDRLFTLREPDEPTWAPTDDFRDKNRIDNPTKANVGSGQFPFFDKGALEANESPLRVIALRPFFTSTVVPGPVGTFEIDFAGRVNMSTIVLMDNPLTPTVDERTVKVTQGAIVRIITSVANSYDPARDIHTLRFTFDQPLADGNYCVYVDGTSTGTSPGAVRDIAGQLLDGEFPPPATAPVFSFPSGNNVPGGDLNYCFTVVTSSIGDLVWNDLNGDGIRQAGEGPLPNVQLTLLGAGPDNLFGTGDDVNFPNAITNSSGNYTFALLNPGLYRVDVVQASLPANFVNTNPPLPRDILLGVNDHRTDVDLGFWRDLQNAVIGNLVWNDANGNTAREPSEAGIGGVRIDMVGSGPDRVLGTADDVVFTPRFTGTDGAYSFTNLPAWTYRVTVDPSSPPLAGFALTTGNQPLVLSLTPGQIVDTADFGYEQANAIVSGRVWEDLDQGGDFDAGTEFGFFAARVFIDANNNNNFDGGERFTFTDGQGLWDIGGLISGTYKVMVDTSTLPPPLPWLPTTVHPRSVTLDPGEAESGVDFGFVQDPANATISGRVFRDLDGDRNDDGVVVEGGLHGPTRVFLDLDSDCQFDAGELFVFTTNAAGDYQFTSMPGGTYFVCVDVGTLPAPGGENWVLTSLNSNPKTINLAPSSNSAGNVFGFQDQRASISGVVWLDNGTGGGTAGDGIRQPGEAGRVSGVTMFDDLNNNGVLDLVENERVSNVTPVNGTFTISNLGVGTHRLRILSGKPPTFGESTPVPLIVNVPSPTSGIVGADIGLQEMNGIIQGFVYVDLDGNGSRGPGENSPVTGATIFLDLDSNGFDADDPFVETDVSGTYTFTGLAPGNYLVGAIAPAPGSVTTTPNPKSIFTDGSSAATQDWGVTGVFGGVFYMTFAISGSLLNSDASALLYTVNDIIRLRVNTDGSWQYTIYFDGSNFGLSTANERIDAFYIVPASDTPVGFSAGQILVSTAGAFSVQNTYTGGVGSGSNVSGFGEDVIVITPTAYNGDGMPQSGTWALRFDGSTRRLTGTAGNIDALGLQADGTMLLSTAGFVSGLPGSVTTYGEDIIRYNFVSRNYSRFFDGSQVGLSGTSENVDGFFLSGGGATPDIVLTTVGSFTVPVNPVSGTSSDLVKFTPTSLGATTAGTFGPGLFLAASDFGHAGKNIKGIQLGLAPFDSPQLTAGARRVQDHDNVVVRWSEEVNQLQLYIDPTGLSADQAGAIRRAIGTASTAWQTTAGKSLLEVNNAGLADVIIRGDRTTAIGGKAQGVLGYTNLQYDVAVHGLLPNGTPYTEFVGREVAGPGSITFVVDWNWYTGVSPLGMKRGQYDLQTTALHELGHMLGLPDRTNDRRSAMAPRLSSNQTRRQFSSGDLSSLDKLYSEPAPVVRALADAIDYSARNSDASARATNDGQALNFLFADLDDSSNTLAKRRAAQLASNLEQLWESPV